jgi:hypothetical protein
MEDDDLPILVRKGSSVRGSEIVHSSGRRIIPCDNSPAQWAFNLAYCGKVPTTNEIKEMFSSDRVPISFSHKKAGKSQRRYHCTLGKFTVNKKKWKLCHFENVGLKSTQSLEDIDIALLKNKFFLLLSPQNHFLLSLDWGGLGEVKEFIDGFQK